MKSFFQNNNNIEICLTHNEIKSVVVEGFIRSSKNEIYKYMTLSKFVYIDKLDEIINAYNNTYHREIKMKPVAVNPSPYIDFDKRNNDKDPKFKIGDFARISKYKNIFEKVYVPNWSEEFFVITKVKNTVGWTCVISDINGQEIVVIFCKKGLKKAKRK